MTCPKCNALFPDECPFGSGTMLCHFDADGNAKPPLPVTPFEAPAEWQNWKKENELMRPELIDVTQGIQVSHISTHAPGKIRWTEMSIYYFPSPIEPRKHWLSEIKGMTTVQGERDLVRRLYVGTLDRAAKLFHDSTEARILIETAREWVEEQRAGLNVSDKRDYLG